MIFSCEQQLEKAGSPIAEDNHYTHVCLRIPMRAFKFPVHYHLDKLLGPAYTVSPYERDGLPERLFWGGPNNDQNVSVAD